MSSEQGLLRVTVIVGSTRQGRFGPVVAGWLTRVAGGREDMAIDVVDPAAPPVPALGAHLQPDDRALLAAVSSRLAAADAFVVVTPEYNHSFPASLKNVIDLHNAEWQAKPVAFVSYGGMSGGLRAVEHLRQVFAELHAVAIRDTVSFHNAWEQFTGTEPRDAAGAAAAAKVMLDQLAWWARALRDARAIRPYAA